MLEFIIRKFLYYPINRSRDAALPRYARDAREVWIPLEKGEIHALYWEAPKDRPTVLFFHGNAQSVYEWAQVRQDLAAMECGLLLPDYPGYGKSPGQPTETGLFAAGRAALTWLVETAGVPENRVVLFGKSLGGGVAVEVAVGRHVMGMVLESTFRSIPSVSRVLLPVIPADAIFSTERYESIKKIGSIRSPCLVIHGTLDELIPLAEGQALYEAANPPKDLFLVTGAGHNNVSLVAGTAYGKRLRAWLDGVQPEGGR